MICTSCHEDHIRLVFDSVTTECDGCGARFRAGVEVYPCDDCSRWFPVGQLMIAKDDTRDDESRCEDCHEERCRSVARERAIEEYEESGGSRRGYARMMAGRE